MKGKQLLIVIFGTALVLMLSLAAKQQPASLFYIPKSWPKPAYDFRNNPLTAEEIALGRKLFYDPILSRDNTISCASCHSQYNAFAHVDHTVSHGIEGRKGTRNAPALMNLAWGSKFHWDGGVNHLEVQPINPITHPLEMDNSMENVVKAVNASAFYKAASYRCFGDSILTGQHLLKAITQFVLTLQSYNSKYDKYMRKEADGELSEQELNGLSLFRKNCASCHQEPLFTNESFANNGLAIDTFYKDLGRYNITQNPVDSFMFKVPTLRNIEYSYPYMHDGRFKRLGEVLHHYADGGVVQYANLSNELKRPIPLNEHEQKDIIAFLLTLTDKTFLYHQAYGFPNN
jgi:cytochrome c peroxidase